MSNFIALRRGLVFPASQPLSNEQNQTFQAFRKSIESLPEDGTDGETDDLSGID